MTNVYAGWKITNDIADPRAAHTTPTPLHITTTSYPTFDTVATTTTAEAQFAATSNLNSASVPSTAMASSWLNRYRPAIVEVASTYFSGCV